MKRKVRLTVFAVVALVVMVWVAGEIYLPQGVDGPVSSAAILSPGSDQVLRGACFDCHSNQTRIPWYGHLPGVGLVLAQHIREGRRELNFSLWDNVPPERRRKWLKESLESIQKGKMPVREYTWLHPEARLTSGQISAIERDAGAKYGVSAKKNKENGKGGGERGERNGGRERDDDDD